MLAVSQRNTPIWVWRNKQHQPHRVPKVKLMTTYVFFDEALHMLANAFLISATLLIAVSGIGLAVIETIEKTGER
jgi:hypothetical protein